MAYNSPTRERFERWISSQPIEADISRYPDNATEYAWPGNYRTYNVQLAWEAWCEAWEAARQ